MDICEYFEQEILNKGSEEGKETISRAKNKNQSGNLKVYL